MEALTKYVTAFTKLVGCGRVEVYNEFSLQHEFGIFLRDSLPSYKVQFERNVKFFFVSKIPFSKKEIDIAIFSSDKKDLQCAIELKYPRNGQYPEQMFSFCKDIAFTEELCAAGFSTSGLVIFADDRLFFDGAAEGIYAFFRGNKPIHGQIKKPTGKQDDEVVIRGSYPVHWQRIAGSLAYAVIEVPYPHPLD